jgi:hypothetical protein
MIVRIDASCVRVTRGYEYLLRFLFGGLITALAGVIADKFGPAVGGLFLAFPAIFPASATLIEKHQKEKKEQHGLDGKQRGRDAAALEAAGSAMGSVGLLLFAALLWTVLPNHQPAIVLAAATAVWAIVSVALWLLRRKSFI